MLKFLGIACLLVAALGLIWNLKESYDSHCGEIGQIPIIGVAVIQLPLITVLGMSIFDQETHIVNFLWWTYPVLWLASATIFSLLTILAGRLGNYVHKKRKGFN
jgi:hypothetical protein